MKGSERNINKAYLKVYKKVKENPKISYTEYREIYNKYMAFLFQKMLDGYEISLGGRLGSLVIKGKKYKIIIPEDGGRIQGLAPNWPATKELWENNQIAKEKKTLVYHKNFDTDGIIYKCCWNLKEVHIGGSCFYNFELTRPLKRGMAKHIKKGATYQNR